MGGARRAGASEHLGEPLPVVEVLVGGDDPAEPVVAQLTQQPVRLVGGVDQKHGAGCRAAQEVGVVVHWPDRDLRDHQRTGVTTVARPAYLDVAAIGLGHDPEPMRRSMINRNCPRPRVAWNDRLWLFPLTLLRPRG